jgi:hypothetical protein
MRRTIARVVPRILLGAVLLPGFACLITGIGQSGDVRNAYQVEFGRPGDTCDASVDVHLDVATGEPVTCTGLDIPVGAGVGFAGFTAERNREIASLAARLGEGGLTDAEQRQVQARVDEIAATVPEEDRPYRYSGLWGTGLALLGGAIIAAGVLLFILWRHRIEALVARLPWPG